MSKRRKPRGERTRGLPQRYWVIGLAIGLLALVLAVVLWFPNRGDNASAPTKVNLDKSKGEPGAPVTVMEYGDFQ
ncbi:MAG: hypothetical protein M1132_08455 [Chloroflexi bacterium]|nr:hypothetical protein [Chloroflexota bacterium]